MKRSRLRNSNSNEIPEEARLLLMGRDHGLCVVCGLGGSDAHHRRSRRVRDEHTHCLCNLVTLCRTDHSWAHLTANREQVKVGLVVSQWEPVPRRAPLLTHDAQWWQPLCTGQWIRVEMEYVERQPDGSSRVLEPF